MQHERRQKLIHVDFFIKIGCMYYQKCFVGTCHATNTFWNKLLVCINYYMTKRAANFVLLIFVTLFCLSYFLGRLPTVTAA